MRFQRLSLLAAPVVLAAAALTATPAMAATRVNVPFSFTAAGKQCPAGTYLVKQNSVGTAVVVEGPAGSFTWVAGRGNAAPTDNSVILRFVRVGQTHQLRSVQYGQALTGRLDTGVERVTSIDEVHGR